MSAHAGAAVDRLAQICQARPALAADVVLQPQIYRGRRWYLLLHGTTDTQLLLDRAGFEFVSALDGETSVAQILERGDFEEEDAIALLATLGDAEVLRGDLGHGHEGLVAKHGAGRARGLLQVLARPLSIRVPLADPDRLLRALLPLGNLLFTRAGFVVWLLVVAFAGVVAFGERAGLAAHWSSRFMDPANILYLWLLYPLVKGLHELGHGLAAKRWGAQVHELGVMFLVFVPVPYVDASATNGFHSARHRMIVAAAGIFTELLLASLAVLAWTTVAPGPARDLLFDVAVIGGVSTLLFNGNPLLRFDGHYVLMDALEIPNLGTRSRLYLRWLFERHLVGLEVPRPDVQAGEVRWLVAFGIASSIYRILVSVGIALFVASRFFSIGLLLALWFLYQQVLRPLALGVARVVPLARRAGRLPRLTAAVAGGLALVAAGLLFVPVTSSTIADGVVTPPESSVIRARAGGFLRDAGLQAGRAVVADEALVVLEDEASAFEERALLARLDELQAELGVAMRGDRASGDRAEAQRLRERLAAARAELQVLRRERDALTVRSPVAGRFSPAAVLTPGAWVEKGQVLGFVTNADDWRVRAMVSQRDIGAVRGGVSAVEVVMRSSPWTLRQGALFAEKPLAVAELPNRTLGSVAGGPIAVDARDADGVRLLQPMFEVDVQLPSMTDQEYRIGERLLVRFVHVSEPVGPRALRWARAGIQERLGF